MSIIEREYFANQEAKDVVNKLISDDLIWNNQQVSSSFFTSVLSTYFRNNQIYYSPVINPDSWYSSLGFRGDQGELIKMTIPTAKKLAEQFCSIITKNRYEFECITDVNETKPYNVVRLGKAICNYEKEKCKLDLKMEEMCLRTYVNGMYFASAIWEEDAGEIYNIAQHDENVNEVTYRGANLIQLHDLSEVCYDWSIRDWEDLDWVIIKRAVNRYAAIAKNPELRDQLLAVPTLREVQQTYNNLYYAARYNNTDMIYRYEFYHKPCVQLPQGRVMYYYNAQSIVKDEENKYGGIPLFQCIFERINGTNLGYPKFSDLLPAQEMMDNAFSIQATNMAAFGITNILNPRGSDISVNDIADGMNFIDYTPQNAEGGGKPEALNLLSTPREVIDFQNSMKQHLSDLAMINDTLRGSPPSNVTSGAMAATLSANALEFFSSAQKVVTSVVEGLMHQCVVNYQKFSTIEQVVDIIGDTQIAFAKQFLADDIKSIRKIRVRTQSAILSSTAGRMQMGDALLQRGLIKTPNQYYKLIEGLPIESLFEDDLYEQISIQAEMEAILEGKSVAPIMTDNHLLYIKEYKKLIDNPYVRINSGLTGEILRLMTERLALEEALEMKPKLYMALRGVPSPMAQMALPQAGNNSNPSAIMKQEATPSEPSKPTPIQNTTGA